MKEGGCSWKDEKKDGIFEKLMFENFLSLMKYTDSNITILRMTSKKKFTYQSEAYANIYI